MGERWKLGTRWHGPAQGRTDGQRNRLINGQGGWAPCWMWPFMRVEAVQQAWVAQYLDTDQADGMKVQRASHRVDILKE